ncbi:hypothetical protein N0V90_007438 [Kalmusia sp. IMI 367209]|nr:hypothetical protein N0V90_007438 [Kalmusia sp. IMI 367209]
MSLTSPSSAKVQHNYNVYAAPFISHYLKQINQEPGQIRKTLPRHLINYPEYVSSFAGYSFLPRRAPPRFPQTHNQVAGSHGPVVNDYLDYFTIVWQSEIGAQEVENDSFALFKVTLQRLQLKPDTSNTQIASEGPEGHICLFSLIIPGLREDSPHVELGDTLELRQLVTDESINFIEQSYSISRPRWTHVIYHASVHGIHRAEETVYLKVEGLQELDIWPHIPIVVNVIFPLKKRTIHACRDALVFIDDALQKAIATDGRIRAQSRDTNEQQQLVKDMANLVLDNKSLTKEHVRVNGNGVGLQPVISKCDWIRRMLFPVESDGNIQTELRKIPHRALFDSPVNYEQAHAVNSVCTNDYGCLPYLISGPPGTGKTKTIVEMAMQLLNSHTTDHILICAPSEPAADTLALRLKEYLNTAQLLRLNGPWRADNEVPLTLMPYTYMDSDMFSLPPFKQFMAYNIVVTSCKDAAILLYALLTNTDLWTLEKHTLEAFHPESPKSPPSLHWGALLLDEAAQATELDVLSAISAVCPPPEYPASMPQPRFIMAGDEKQLGPKTASRDPRLSISLFARLIDRPIYKNHPLSRTNVKPSTGPPVLRKTMLPILYPPFTNLNRNYRSHPAILSVPSALFYNDTLLPEAPTRSTPLQTSRLWRGRKWPVLFIPHAWVEDIERDGGGWYNVGEAQLACDTAAHLIRYDGVAQSDIAIISPFAAQVKRLRAVMRSPDYGFWDVNIGPLEAFQGLEKRVVIIATTRTWGGRFLEDDAKRGLGLIGQPRKMNVAVTRAKEALVVLGNETTLAKDQHWREWLAFCWRNALIKDEVGLWQEDKERYGGAKVGVLERALWARGARDSDRDGRVLGGKTARLENGFDGSYEAWIESLKEAMNEEEFEEEEAYSDVASSDVEVEGKDGVLG